jgi:hypothetical protein
MELKSLAKIVSKLIENEKSGTLVFARLRDVLRGTEERQKIFEDWEDYEALQTESGYFLSRWTSWKIPLAWFVRIFITLCLFTGEIVNFLVSM